MSISAKIRTGTEYKSEIDWKSVMVVCYASVCMGCQCGPSNSLTLQAASAHYARSPFCFQSQMSLTGIATEILPNRTSDAKKGDIQETAQEWSSARHWRGVWIQVQWFTCLNYTCNLDVRADEFINSMYSYTTEFRGFMKSYTYEFIRAQ
jgi:hypothetical protein